MRSYCDYEEETVAFSRRRELATAQAVLIVGFGPPIEVSFPRLGESVRATAFVSGLTDCFALVESFGSQRGVPVDLTPLGAYVLFGCRCASSPPGPKPGDPDRLTQRW